MFELFEKMKVERQKKALEKDLPSAMHQAAILSTYLPPDEVIKSLSEGKTVLATEFKKAHQSIQKGEDPEIALKKLAEKNKSELFSKAVDILAISYKTGADVSTSLVEIADEISERSRIQRESEVALTIQKYTLLLAAGFIVPVILGLVSSFSQSLQVQFSGLELGLNEGTKKSLMEAAASGTKIYGVLCAVLCSFFVTYLENKKFVFALIYLGILVPCSLVFYGVASLLFA